MMKKIGILFLLCIGLFFSFSYAQNPVPDPDLSNFDPPQKPGVPVDVDLPDDNMIDFNGKTVGENKAAAKAKAERDAEDAKNAEAKAERDAEDAKNAEAERQATCQMKMESSPGCRKWEAKENNLGQCVSLGIILNTNVPGIGKCIKYSTGETVSTAGSTTVNEITAFPTLMGKLVSLLTSILLLVGFIMILIAGVMMTMGGIDAGNYKKGKELIFKVGAAIALLGLSGVILKAINPNFFS